ncbi:MAG: ribose-phosphate diphosphokinase [Gammaproteobacteria bacterium]|nr:ribose-phosphate diphosphokinase [Gammaproteobacteria bacterium]
MAPQMNDCLVLGFPEYQQQASQLAQAAKLPYAQIQIHHFPDGESQLFLPEALPKHLVVCRSLNNPNEKLVELMLVAASARKQGVETISLVAPYLCYMRQDKAFHPGEVVSQILIGELLATQFDHILTVDAHLHRVHDLSDAIPVQKAINITATDPMADFLQNHVNNPFLIGPDSESEQWVASIAQHYNLDYCIASKQRFGDKEVEVVLPSADYHGRHIVIVDDMASTGKTLLATARKLAHYQPGSISVLVTHALFVDNAISELYAAGITNIWSCDTISHATNSISLAHFLAKELQHFLICTFKK